MTWFIYAALCLFAEVSFNDLAEMSLEELLSMEVVTASKSAQKSSDAPATVYVYSDAMIRESGYATLEQLLETIPEIEIQHKASPEFSNWFTLRGVSGNNKFVVLLDGFRINSPNGSPHAIGKNYSLAQAKRVEIILGPASALYGADAFGGIIHIITHRGNERTGLEVDASVGEFASEEVAAAYGYGTEQFSIKIDAHLTQTDEPYFPDLFPEEYAWYTDVYRETGDVLISPFQRQRIATGAPRPFAMPSETSFVHASMAFAGFQVGAVQSRETHSSSTATRPEFNLYVEDARYTTAIESLFGKHTYEHEKFSIQSSLSRGYQEDDPESNFQNTFTQYQPGYKYGYGKTVKWEEQINWTMSEHHQLVGGFSYEDVSALARSGDLPFRFDPSIPANLQDFYYMGTNIVDRNGNDLTVRQQFFELNYKNYGGYLQVQSNWQKILLTAGLRYDDNTRYGNTVNPRVGVVYKPREHWVVKGLYSEGFLAPSPYEAYRHYGATLPADEHGDYTADPDQIVGLRGPFWHLPNPNLKPEELRSTEFTISYQASENVALAADVYETQIDQLIVQTVFVGSDPVYFPDGISFAGIPIDAAEVATNAGTMHLEGGSLRLSSLFPVGAFRLKGNLSYTYSDGDINGGHLPFSAKNTVRAELGATGAGWSVNLNLLNRSESYHPLLNENGQTVANPSFTRVDLFGRYDHPLAKGTLGYFLKVRNLLDKKHYNVSRTSSEGFWAAPQDPRRIEGGLSIRY